MPRSLPEKRDIQQRELEDFKGENEEYDFISFQEAPLKAGKKIAERIK